MSPTPNIPLLVEQLSHFKDVITSKVETATDQSNHRQEVNDLKQKALADADQRHETTLKDHEDRIRALNEQVIAQKTRQTIIASALAALTLICSAIAAFLGAK